jgi:mono/diheme cytochrome c family protein
MTEIAMLQNSYVVVIVFTCLFTLATTAATGDVKPTIEPESASQAESAQQKLPEAQKDRPRGQMLYENHCGGCHETSVHGRSPRVAGSISEIRRWINLWQKELKLNWSRADIDEVTSYINDKYYQFAE